MKLNDHGDYEQQTNDGLVIARFTSEGLLADWFDEDGEHSNTIGVTWDDLYEMGLLVP